ncbi:low temperature requirement protein A [Catellatospora citrea]|nr:low temperature requirement protein A [Catellatospora citrea]RKE12897.1 low temperature requirement A protein (LtrA) [Catellatospora citrea]
MSTASGEGRKVSWLELFFDLVVVAAVVELAHELHHPTWSGGALFLLLFFAICVAWSSFTLYANVAGEQTRRRTMFLAMFGMAVMAAAIPGAAEGRTQVFIIAYVIVRLLGSQAWTKTGRPLLDWPSVQGGLGLLPWVISIWVAAPGRYWLWALGLLIDVLLPMFMPDRTPDGPEWAARLARRRGHAGGLRFASVDRAHLAERCGLFIIIVFGEATMQLVAGAADLEHWTRALLSVAVAGFGLLIGMWYPIFYRDGYLTSHIAALPVRLLLPLLFLTAASITAVASALGSLAALTEDAHHGVPTGIRVTLCLGVAGYYVAAVLGEALRGTRGGSWGERFRLAGMIALGLLVPTVLAAFGGRLAPAALAWSLFGAVFVMAGYIRRVIQARVPAAPPGPAGGAPEPSVA